MEPAVLLMDEPLSNLDALLRLTFRAELKKLVSELGTTAIYVTHDHSLELPAGVAAGAGESRPSCGCSTSTATGGRRPHRAEGPPPSAGRPSAARRKASWNSSRFSATTSCVVMWVTPDRGSTLCGLPAASSRLDSRSVCAATTLSSARPWISSSGLLSPAASARSELRR